MNSDNTKEAKAPMLTLTGYQLRSAANFVNPDPGDTDQLESEVCIQWGPERDDGEGGKEPAGLRVWLADYPEEGSMALDPDKPWPPQDAASPTPAAPKEAKAGEGAALQNATLRALLERARAQFQQWHEKYGEHQPSWLPPAGDVRWLEDVSAVLGKEGPR